MFYICFKRSYRESHISVSLFILKNSTLFKCKLCLHLKRVTQHDMAILPCHIVSLSCKQAGEISTNPIKFVRIPLLTISEQHTSPKKRIALLLFIDMTLLGSTRKPIKIVSK